jgi:hypothetical protein
MGRQNKGKRDGYRIIYYRSATKEVWFLRMFPKNETIDLNANDRKELEKMIKRIEDGTESDYASN